MLELNRWLQSEGLSLFNAVFINRIQKSVSEETLDREQVLARLKPHHDEFLSKARFSPNLTCYAEQVHGAGIAIVDRRDSERTLPQVDGLITNTKELGLGIYVADCGAVYLVDPVLNVIALLHSGKKGTELGITSNAIRMMEEYFGSQPENIRGFLAPCIRPPAYEVDFARQIQEQFVEAGCLRGNFTDCGICTSSDRSQYYSYRMEKGKTGRMLAAFAIRGDR